MHLQTKTQKRFYFFLRKSTILSAILLFISVCNLYAQNDSLVPSIKRTDKTLLQKSIVPAVLIGSSLLITNSNFEKQFQIDIRNEVGNDFHTNLDDYLWYVPLVEMYAADIIGIEAKHHWFDQSKNAFISHLVNKYTTNAFKGLIVKTRPNGYNKNSFPSGHTSKAFTSATVLYEEFKDTSPLLAYSGYIFASSTAVLRIANNAHYVSDVLIGAGLGILITKIVYHFDYLFDWNPFKGKENVMIAPTINNETVGLIGIIQL